MANVEDMTERSVGSDVFCTARHSTGVELQMRRDCGQSSPAMEEDLEPEMSWHCAGAAEGEQTDGRRWPEGGHDSTRGLSMSKL